MKSSLLSLFFLVTLITTSFAAIGDKCRSAQGTGTCKNVNSCTSGTHTTKSPIITLLIYIGFTVNGACPNDGQDIKCCIGKSCTIVQKAPLQSLGGHCFDKDRNSCSGGKFYKGFCPGDASVQCCVGSGT